MLSIHSFGKVDLKKNKSEGYNYTQNKENKESFVNNKDIQVIKLTISKKYIKANIKELILKYGTKVTIKNTTANTGLSPKHITLKLENNIPNPNKKWVIVFIKI